MDACEQAHPHHPTQIMMRQSQEATENTAGQANLASGEASRKKPYFSRDQTAVNIGQVKEVKGTVQEDTAAFG